MQLYFSFRICLKPWNLLAFGLNENTFIIKNIYFENWNIFANNSIMFSLWVKTINKFIVQTNWMTKEEEE